MANGQWLTFKTLGAIPAINAVSKNSRPFAWSHSFTNFSVI